MHNMKRLAIVLLLIFMSPLAIPLLAQSEYSIGKAFDGSIVPREETREITITKADQLPGDLISFHSVEFLADDAVMAAVTSLIDEDAKLANDKETTVTGGKLTYAILRFEKKVFNKYICFSAKPEEYKFRVTILFIEGPDSIKDLKKTFSK